MRLPLLLACLLGCFAGLTSAPRADEPEADATPYPGSPPPGASLPVPGPQSRVARNDFDESITLRDIDDPAGPYFGKYGAADRWFFEHYVPAVTEDEEDHFTQYWPVLEEDSAFRATYPKDWAIGKLWVDKDGWFRPMGLYPPEAKLGTLREEIMSSHRRGPYEPSRDFYFWYAGVRPKDNDEKFRLEAERKRAAEMPRIPAWLGSNPPVGTVFVDNGDILAYGPLGLHVSDPRGKWLEDRPEGEAWYRYSPDGHLLGTYALPSGEFGASDWRDIYADWDALEAQLRALGYPVQQYGMGNGDRAYVEYGQPVEDKYSPYAMANVEKIIAAYNWKGEPIDLDAAREDSWYSLRNMQYPRSMVENYYRLQVEAGLTDPQEKSAWAGTPEGPVTTDPTPRIPKLTATRLTHGPGQDRAIYPHTNEKKEIRAFDDPANPFLGQYGAWDRWIFEHFGQSNPRQSEIYNRQERERQRELRQARREKRDPDPKVMQRDISYNDLKDQAWQMYEAEVDGQGFPIPYVLAQTRQTERSRKAVFERDYREQSPNQKYEEPFKYWGAGEMPAEMKAAMEQARKDAVGLQPIPPVPDWLAAAPPYWVIFIPNGEYLTYGGLGSWLAGWQDLPKEQRKPAGGWYRYSATGELLGHVEAQTGNVMQLFNPMLPSLELSGKSQGYEVEQPAGYLIWRNPREKGGEAVSAWDYDGTPLPLDKPITRVPGMWHNYTWEEIKYKMESETAHNK